MGGICWRAPEFKKGRRYVSKKEVLDLDGHALLATEITGLVRGQGSSDTH
jgi:hypothetical protein